MDCTIWHCSRSYCTLWVLSLWIALFDTVAGVTVHYECFHYGLHCLVGVWWGCRPTPLGQLQFWCGCSPRAANTWRWGWPACMAANPSERVWTPAQDALALGLALGPNSDGSGVMTHCSWVLYHLDPVLLGLASGPNPLRSPVKTQGSWAS
jgi:hypothetical protein